MKKNRKNSTKSLLACAVLAGVLAGGVAMPQAFAVTRNSFWLPSQTPAEGWKEATTIFGEIRGHAENGKIDGTEGNGLDWYILRSGENNSLLLLAKHEWGEGALTKSCGKWKYNWFGGSYFSGTTRMTAVYYDNILQPLNDELFMWFRLDELKHLVEREVELPAYYVFGDSRSRPSGGWWTHYAFELHQEEPLVKKQGVFQLPTYADVLNLTESDRKNADGKYYLADYDAGMNCKDVEYDFDYFDSDGSIIEASGKIWGTGYYVDKNGKIQTSSDASDDYYFAPTIEVDDIAFISFEDKSGVAANFVPRGSSSTKARLTLFDRDREYGTHVENLKVTANQFDMTVSNLPVGEKQGVGGLLYTDAYEGVSHYARLYNGGTTFGGQKVDISTQLHVANGEYNFVVFNEELTNKEVDYASYFRSIGKVGVDSTKITSLQFSVNNELEELTIGDGIKFSQAGDVELRVMKKMDWANVLTANGQIRLGGSFEVDATDTLTLTKAGAVDNAIYFKGTDATLKKKVSMSNFTLEGGDFTAKETMTLTGSITANGNFTAEKEMSVAKNVTINGGIFTAKENMSVPGTATINAGTFKSEKDLSPNVLNNMAGGTVEVTENVNASKITNSGTMTVGGTLSSTTWENKGTASVTGDVSISDTLTNTSGTLTLLGNVTTKNFTNASGTATVGGVMTVDGSVTVGGTLNVAKSAIDAGTLTLQSNSVLNVTGTGADGIVKATNVTVADGAKITGGGAKVETSVLQMKGSVEASSLQIGNYLFTDNGGNDTLKAGTLAFGDSAYYYYDFGKDKIEITDKATGKLRISPKGIGTLSNGDKIEVLNGGNLGGLQLLSIRVADSNRKNYILTQDKADRGKMQVKEAQHKTVIAPGSLVRGQSIVFGNITSGVVTGPVVWDVVVNNGNAVTVFSQKGLQSFPIWPKRNGEDDRGGAEAVLNEFQKNFKYDSSQWVRDNFSIQEAMAFGKNLGVPNWAQLKNGGTFGLTAEQRKGKNGKYGINEFSQHGFTAGSYAYTDFFLKEVDENGNVYETPYNQWGLAKYTLARPYMNLNKDYVLFASVRDGGKGDVTVGGLAVLPEITNTSTLELTMDDFYLAHKTGTARQTGDVQLTQLNLVGSVLNVDYEGGLYKDGKSYLSYFVGEGDAAADYFAYGKAAVMGKGGSGNSGNINLAPVKDNALNGEGMALTFFNEYGNGTSWAGNLAELPGRFTFGTDGNLIYTVGIADIGFAVDIGEKNILKVSDTSYAGVVSAPKITGRGVFQIDGNLTFSGDNKVFQGKVEVLNGNVVTLAGNKIYPYVEGRIKLTQDTTFMGTKLAGEVFSDTGNNHKLILGKDLEIVGDLIIADLNGTDTSGTHTLDMRQGEGTPTYNTLTIEKLWGNAYWAIDLGKPDTDFVADKIVLNGVEGGAKITLNAINLIDDPQLTTTWDTKTIYGVVGGTEKGNVEVASDFVAYGANYKYTVSLDGSGDLTLAYDGVNSNGFKEFVRSGNTASYSFVDDTTLDEAVTTGNGSGSNITKTVFLNGHTLNSHTSSTPPDPLPNGITVANTHTMVMKGGTVTGFATALNVVSGGTLNLQNMTVTGNTTDVNNAGTMNIGGNVTIGTLTGSGTTDIGMGAKLDLGSGSSQTLTQNFTGDGTLNFVGNATLAVKNLGTETNTVAGGITLTFTSSGTDADKTLNRAVSGAGKIGIGNGTEIITDVGNLQVSEVDNAGTLKIKPTTENEDKINSLKPNITGGGSLELHYFNETHGAITQNTVTIAKNSTLDAYKTVTATQATDGITNKGAAFFFVGDLQGDVTNVVPADPGDATFPAPGGSTLLNGLIALYTDTNNRTLQKKITDGYIGIMGEVIADAEKLNGDAYIAAGHTLTVQGGSGIAKNVLKTIQGAEILGYGRGSLVTEGELNATLDNILMPLENKGKMTLTNGSTNHNMDKMTSIINSGDMVIDIDITIDKDIINSGKMDISAILSGNIANSGEVTMTSNSVFESSGKIEGGKVSLANGVNFKASNLVNIAELYVDEAIYNFNANLAGTPSVDIIDAEKVEGFGAGETLHLGTVTLSAVASAEEWGLGEVKEARFLKDTTSHTVVVGNTTAAFDSDCKYTFGQAKNDDTSDKIGFLSISKTKGAELWQIIRGKTVDGYDTSDIRSYSLTRNYQEELKDITGETVTDALGTLQKSDTTAPTNREFTINGNGFVFDGNNNKGIIVGTGGILNFLDMGDITGWADYVVTNNGTVNFNGTNVLNSKVSGGTVTNAGILTVPNVENLDFTTLSNTNSVVLIGDTTERTLPAKIDGGIVAVEGHVIANISNLAVTNIIVDTDTDDDTTTFNKLEITGSAGAKLENVAVQNYGILEVNIPVGNITIQNAETLNLNVGVTTSDATIIGGKVNIDENLTTTKSIVANEINIGGKNLTISDADGAGILLGKLTATTGKVIVTGSADPDINPQLIAMGSINSNIELGENTILNIDADDIQKDVKIGNNATVNLGDGTLRINSIADNSGTVNFLGDIKVDTGVSLPKANFANGSMLTLDVSGGTAPLTITDSITVADGAKLYLTGATKNETSKILQGTAITSTFTGWAIGNIRGIDAEGHKVKGKEAKVEGDKYLVLFKSLVPETTDLSKVLQNADGTPLMDWAEQVSDALDIAYGDAGEKYAAGAMNTLANLNALANVQQGTQMVNSITADAIQSNIGTGLRPILGHRAEGVGRNSGNRGQVSGVRNVSTDVKLASPLEGKRADKGAWSGEGVNETAIETVEQGKSDEVMPTMVENEPLKYEKTVWANFIHSKKVINGLKTGSLEQNSTIQFNGVTVGADLWSHRKGFGGLALTTAEGKSNSSQPGASVKNETDYQGVSLYNRYDYKGLALLMDLTYTHSKNDVSLSALGALDVTAKPKADAYSAGLKIEKPIKIGHSTQVTPYTGARFTHIHTDKYSDNRGMSYDIKDQNIVSVPVGVQLKTEYATQNGWRYGHIFEGGYVWNIGNRQSEQRLGYQGVYDSIDFDVTDRGEYFLKTALTANHKDTDFELGYRFTRGDNTKDNKWNFNVTYNFGNANGMPYKSVLLGKIDLLESANKALRAELVEVKAENKRKDMELAEKDAEIERLKALLASK